MYLWNVCDISYEHIRMFIQVREVGLQYYNCADNMLVKDIVARLEAKRRTAIIRHFSRNEECAELLGESRAYVEETKEPIASVSIQQWINNSCCANVAMNKCVIREIKTMSPLVQKKMCVTASEKSDDVCKDTDVFTVTVGQCGKQMYNYNKNYAKMKLQEESKLKR